MAKTIINFQDPATRIAQASSVVALLRPAGTEDSGYASVTSDVVERALWTVQTLLEQARAGCKADLATQHLQQASSIVALLRPGAQGDEDSGYAAFTRDVVENSLNLVSDLLAQAQVAVEAA